MSEFAMRAFCRRCGRMRMTMPFGDANPFWDRTPCRACGDDRAGEYVIAARRRIGRWPWQRGWVDPDGNTAPAGGAKDGAS